MGSPYDVMRARQKEENLGRAARCYCEAHEDEIMRAIDRHAPELRELLTEETDAVIVGLRIHAGDTPREIVSPRLIKQYVRQQQEEGGRE